MNKHFFIIAFLVLSSCGNQSNNINKDCKNLYSNEKLNFDLCLPSENWQSDIIEKYLVLNKKLKDSLPINNTVFTFMIDDYKEHLKAESLRDRHLKSMQASTTMKVELLSKGSEIINKKTFFDYEIKVKKNSEYVYSYFLFYTMDNYGYVINASIAYKIRNGLNKSDINKVFGTFNIKGNPKLTE